MSALQSSVANLVKLKSPANYHEWKFNVENLLVINGYGDYMDNKLNPDNYNQKEDEKAVATLLSTINYELAQSIVDCVNVKEEGEVKCSKTYNLFAKISSTVNQETKSYKLKLVQEFDDFSANGSVISTINKMKNIKRQHTVLKIKMDDIFYCYKLFKSLDNSIQQQYSYLITSKDELQFESFCNTLAGAGSSFMNPLVINHSEKNKNKKKKKNVYCKICKVKGHHTNDCKKKEVNSLYNKTSSSNYFLLDSGASSNFISCKKLLSDYTPVTDTVKLANGDTCNIIGTGYLNFYGANLFCYYIPNLKRNIICPRDLIKENFKIDHLKSHIRVINPSGKILYFNYANNLPIHKFINMTEKEEIIHDRLGHPNLATVKNIIKNQDQFYGDNISKSNLSTCQTCQTAKIKKSKFGIRNYNRATQPLVLIHLDLIGPICYGPYKYSFTITDEYSRYTQTYYMKCKSETISKIREFKVFAEQQTGNTIKRIQCDVGGEFIGIETFCKENGIIQIYSPPYTPELNGTAESTNRILNSKVRCLLLKSSVPLKYWHYAHECAAYLRNITLNSVVSKTPYELFFGIKPKLSNLKVFGCKAIVKLIKKDKFLPNGKEMVFIGYHHDFAYKVLDIEKDTVYVRRDVSFVEKEFPCKNKVKNSLNENDEISFIPVYYSSNESNNGKVEEEAEDNIEDDGMKDNFIDNDSDAEKIGVIDDNNPPIHPGNLKTIKKLTEEALRQGLPIENTRKEDLENLLLNSYNHYKITKKSFELNNVHIDANEEVDIPTTLKEAKSSKYSKQWKEAMDEEMLSLKQNDTWKLVTKTNDIKPIRGKFIFSLKRDKSGNIIRFKARYVIQGCSQDPNSYNSTYAPVIKSESFRFIMAYTAMNKFKLRKIDIITAFLNGIIDEDIYMYQPSLYKDKNQPNHVCKLQKSLYGLKQAPFCWNRELVKALNNHGFTQLKSDPCVWFKNDMVIGYHVDDFIISYKDDNQLEDFKKSLNQFKLVDLGSLDSSSITLGINIDRTINGIKLSQPNLINDIIKQCELNNAKAVKSPTYSGQKLTKDMVPSNAEEQKQSDNFPYASIVGKLNFLSVWTRPDITFAVNNVARFNSNPGPEHIASVKRIVKYLIGTKNEGVVYSYGGASKIDVFSDADWANSENRRSQSGYILYFSDGPIIWSSKQQKCVADSTMESEFYALALAVKELLWLKKFINELNIDIDTPTIYEDNQSCITFCQTQQSIRAKHIDIKYHFVKDYLQKNYFNLKYCPSERMVADVLTKPLGPIKFQSLVKQTFYHSGGVLE